MITVMLQGGLGNQMFQYAFGLATAKRLKTELALDIDLLKYDVMRQYSLGLFKGVTESIVTGSKANVNEDGLPYNQAIVDNLKDGDVIRGYWQSEKYFDYRYEEISERFQPKRDLPQILTPWCIEQIKSAHHPTFLTVRRTDYVTKQDYHGVLSTEYYRNALMHLISRNAQPTVFVFSDEPEWCQSNLDIGMPFKVLGTYDRTTSTWLGREDVDLYLMSLCRFAIMANSSFSWWGAWLGELRGNTEIITAPKQWFTTSDADSRDIVPARWVRL